MSVLPDTFEEFAGSSLSSKHIHVATVQGNLHLIEESRSES